MASVLQEVAQIHQTVPRNNERLLFRRSLSHGGFVPPHAPGSFVVSRLWGESGKAATCGEIAGTERYSSRPRRHIQAKVSHNKAGYFARRVFGNSAGLWLSRVVS